MAHNREQASSGNWTNLDATAVNVEKLNLLCSSQRALKKEGYVVASLTSNEMLQKLRCRNCGAKMKPPNHVTSRSPYNVSTTPSSTSTENHASVDRGPRPVICEFHPGKVMNLHFTCCQAHVSIQKGCQINDFHEVPANYGQELSRNWTYHVTPSSSVPSRQTLVTTGRRRGRFANSTPIPGREAVALDCEFGVSLLNEAELIRITAVDFFSREVLIDSLVKPDAILKSYATRYSGVTSADMRNAVRNRTCIFGRDAARNKLLEFVNNKTVIVVHGGSSDMSSLRWIHPSIVDTFILETYFDALPGGRSLKNICKKKLGLDIQRGRGHDSHEDALACRELAIWLMNIIPNA